MQRTSNYRFLRLFLCCLFLIFTILAAEALDPPHFQEGERYCENCHKESYQSSFPALCMSCHNPTGVARAKPFSYTDQVEIGVKGTSHRFDSEGLKYVKMRVMNGSTGLVKVTPGSRYRGNFDTQNEMEYEYQVAASGAVGVSSFKYRCRFRSKTSVDNVGPWAYEVDWGGWSTPVLTGSAVSMGDTCGLGADPGISLTFEDGESGTSFVSGASGRVYIKLLNRPDNQGMRTRMQETEIPGLRSINCSVCHNQHFQEKDRPYLRIKNIRNSLCKHCHSDREKGHYVQTSGISTGGGLLFLEDTTQNWKTDEWVGKQVYFQRNFGGIQSIEDQEAGLTDFNGFYRTIIANDRTKLQWDAADPLGAPGMEGGFDFKIVDPKNIGSHPLSVPYAAMDMEERFFPNTGNLVLDDNETPDDPKDDTVQCMTCHSPHFAHTADSVGGEALDGTKTTLRVDTSYEKWESLAPDQLVGQEIRINSEFIRWKRDTGVTNSGSNVSVTDISKNWEIDAFIGARVEVAGQVRVVISNTANTIFWIASNPVKPAIGSSASYTLYYHSQVAEMGTGIQGSKTTLTANRPGVAKSGLTTAGNLTSLSDVSKNWTVNGLIGAKVEVFAKNQKSIGLRTITSNTANIISWIGGLTEAVGVGNRYNLHSWQINSLQGAKVEIFDRDQNRIGLRVVASNDISAMTWQDPLDLPVEDGFTYQLYVQGGKERGFATGGDSKNLVDTSQNWQTNELIGAELVITLKRTRPISNNCVSTNQNPDIDYTKFKICWDDSLSSKADLGDIYYIFDASGNVIEKGQAVDGGLKFLIDTTKKFNTLNLTGATIKMYQKNERIITYNTADTISWAKLSQAASDYPLTFSIGDEYYIRYRNINWRRKRIVTSNTSDTITWSTANPLEGSINPGDIFEVVNINKDLEERAITSNTADTINWDVPLKKPIRSGNVYLFDYNTPNEITGNATDGTVRSLVDSSQNWTVDSLVGKIVRVDRRGKGFILDKANDETLCMSCHRYQYHFGEMTIGETKKQCRDCHTPHNTTNRFLLREVINNRRVIVRPGDNYVRADRKGICQVCHTQALHWRNNASEPEQHYANGCPQCHNHSDPERSWKYRCSRCHGKPPIPAGTRIDSEGHIVGSDGKIDNFLDNDGTRIDPIGLVAEYDAKNELIRSSIRKWGESFEYRVEDYEGGGGAHLVHVIGKGFLCDKCHGHIGYGAEHGGSVGRIKVERKNITFNFDLDYSLNQHEKGKPVTKIGYQWIDSSGDPIYPGLILETEERKTGTSSVYVNRADGTGGYGPGGINMGDGGFSAGVFDPGIAASDTRNPVQCRVGCHNPRRLYLQNEPENDMANIFNWSWIFPMEGCRDNPDCDPNVVNLPRDEVPDVPCAKCHDAQGILVQGAMDNDINYDPYPQGSNKQKIVSSHPVDPTVRDDCRVCHDYYNAQSPHTGGEVYLRDKDGGEAILWDENYTASIEPFCLSCHDADGATEEANPRSPFSVERSVEPNIEVPDIKVYWENSVHTAGANLTCFGDGSRTGCHGNPHGSTNVSLLAKYNQHGGNDRYFCFNCHGYGLGFSPTNPNETRPKYGPAIRDQIEKRLLTGGSGHPISAPGDVWTHRRKESTITNARHSECIDCHDPMSDNKTNRLRGQVYLDVTGNAWDPGKDIVTGDNPMAGDVQLVKNGDGTTSYKYWNDPVKKTGPAPHNPAESYYVRQPYVYEVCFRCHGPNYATFFKDYNPFPDVAPDRVGPTGHFSNKMKEFDPRSIQYADYPNGSLGSNTSYHPVASPGRNATEALFRQLKGAFPSLTAKEDLKSLTIVCTDCHNNDSLAKLRGPATYSNRRPTDGDPLIISGWNNYSWDNPNETGLLVPDYQRQSGLRIGPHGSENIRMLRAPYETRVFKTRNARGAYNTVKGSSFALCFLCHDEDVLTETDGGAPGTNFGGTGNGWWGANLHAEHLSSPSYSGSEGGGAVCHECHQNVHSNVEARNTIFGDGLGGMLPPDAEDGILDGVSSTHLINFGPQATGATAMKPRWYYDGQYYRCNLYCHGANMQYCFYKHGTSGTLSQWCEDDA